MRPAVIGAAMETQIAHWEGETGMLTRPGKSCPGLGHWLEDGGTSGRSRQFEQRPRG